MFLFSIFVVVWIGLLCNAAPSFSDLSRRSIPFTGVPHSDLYNDATGKEDHLHTEIPTLKRNVEVDEASRLCPGTQIAVNFGGTSKCIDDVYGSVKHGLKREVELVTEGRGCLCWDFQFPVRIYGACMCIKKRDSEGRTTIRESTPREHKSHANRAGSSLCYYFRGEKICTGLPEDIEKRDSKPPATTGDFVPHELESIANGAEDCPAGTFPLCYYVLGERICRCEPEQK